MDLLAGGAVDYPIVAGRKILGAAAAQQLHHPIGHFIGSQSFQPIQEKRGSMAELPAFGGLGDTLLMQLVKLIQFLKDLCPSPACPFLSRF